MSTCGVCIGVSDYDAPDFYNESTPTARKEHKCCECGVVITAGSEYFKVTGKWDGVLETFRQCMPCHEIQRVFSCDEGWLYGGLWESWNDADGFRNLTVFDPCFQKLSAEARQFLVERWWEWRVDHELDHESPPPHSDVSKG